MLRQSFAAIAFLGIFKTLLALQRRSGECEERGELIVGKLFGLVPDITVRVTTNRRES
jgi:hypothetical protein